MQYTEDGECIVLVLLANGWNYKMYKQYSCEIKVYIKEIITQSKINKWFILFIIDDSFHKYKLNQ